MRRWVLLLILLAGVFAGLRGVHALAEPAVDSRISTQRVVVVGVTGRSQLDDTDRQVLATHLGDTQAGAVSVRARLTPDCAAAGWTTLGAGRRAGIGGLCDPRVANDVVLDWADRTTEAAAGRGDARLGTLADSVAGCVGTVGPGAALAGASRDGAVPGYRTAAEFVADGLTLTCPVTLVDAGAGSDAVIQRLATTPDVTLIVTGVGPAAGSDDRSLQVIYRLGTTLPGWLTSASTRREGIVTLTDLTRTLIDFAPARPGTVPLTVDGSPLTVQPATLTVPLVADRLDAVAALSAAIPIAYLGLGGMGAVLVVGCVALAGARRRLAPLKGIVLGGAALPTAMLLTGSLPWAESRSPGVAVCLAAAACWLVTVGAVLLVARGTSIDVPIAAAVVAVTAFTVDAALGGPMQPGSLLNSRPILGLRWYGFGNNTFAAYAFSALLLAGYVAHRLRAAGRPRAALVAVAAIGFGVVICEGWPSMGSDFGGVIALTPPVLGLLLVLSGVRLSPLRLIAVGGSAVLAIGAISLLDWRRGPDRRSHLGNFVQRVLDGDAVDVVSRKAVASAETIVSVPGLVAVVFGVAVFGFAFRVVAPGLVGEFSTVRPVLLAVLATGILGTVLNDAGVYVWLSVSIVTAFAMVWYRLDAAAPNGSPPVAWARGRHR